jgi:hypothetical protein
MELEPAQARNEQDPHLNQKQGVWQVPVFPAMGRYRKEDVSPKAGPGKKYMTQSVKKKIKKGWEYGSAYTGHV